MPDYISHMSPKTGRSDPALLRPDAILELGTPGRRRRLFLELESGLIGLEPGERRAAHVERRIDRYATFFTGFTRNTDRTWYDSAFPDLLRPELVLLVHGASRLAQVERLIAERTRGAELRFGLRAFTVASAAAALAAAAGGPSSAPDVQIVRLDAELVRRLGDGLDLFIQAVKALQVAGADHNKVCPNFYMPPLPADELNAFCRRLRHDVLGIPRPSGAKP